MFLIEEIDSVHANKAQGFRLRAENHYEINKEEIKLDSSSVRPEERGRCSEDTFKEQRTLNSKTMNVFFYGRAEGFHRKYL